MVPALDTVLICIRSGSKATRIFSRFQWVRARLISFIQAPTQVRSKQTMLLSESNAGSMGCVLAIPELFKFQPELPDQPTSGLISILDEED